jgi:hypothetical protein
MGKCSHRLLLSMTFDFYLNGALSGTSCALSIISSIVKQSNLFLFFCQRSRTTTFFFHLEPLMIFFLITN